VSGYGLIGEKLSHSFSPQIHAMLGSYDYRLFELSALELPGFMRETSLLGFNVTIPYKQAVIPYLSGLSDAARRIGSVNTVIRQPNGTLFGDNTDYFGFERLLDNAIPLKGKKALILGSGGASRTVQAVLADADLSPIVVISRKGDDNYSNLEKHHDASLIVNATPVGMYPDVEAAPLDLSCYDGLQLVLDLIYNPARTRLLLDAEDLGIPCRNGLLMLAAQALRASELFGQRLPGDDISREIVARLERHTLNITLIGMPGCGKTSVGKALARLTGRPFHDTDEMIWAESGSSPAQIIALRGEAAFRALETKVLAGVCKESHAIIATGGGVVTRPENRNLLRQNSRVVLLERPLHLLPTNERPLSQAEGLEALYQKRQPLYLCWSDRRYTQLNIEATAKAIKEDLL
jgi:shikimate dehydrogenase